MDSIAKQTKIDLIRKQPVFTGLTDEEVDVLAGILKEVSVPAGEVVVKEGDPVDSVYLIINGTAEVRRMSYADPAQPKVEFLATLGPDQAIGLNETGFYSLSGVRTATVIANEDMTLLRLSVAAFHGFALAYSHVNEVMKRGAKDILGTS